MTTLGKVLIGAAVAVGVAVGAVTVYTVVKKDKTEEESKKLKDRIAKAATDKVIKILGFVSEHSTEITAFTTLVGAVSAVAGCALRFNKLYSHNVLLDRLNKIEKDTYKRGWASGYDYLFKLTDARLRSCALEHDPFSVYDVDGNPMVSYNISLA